MDLELLESMRADLKYWREEKKDLEKQKAEIDDSLEGLDDDIENTIETAKAIFKDWMDEV